MGQRTQRVDALDGLDLQLVGVEHHPLLAAVDGDRQHQHRRLRGRGNRTHLAADDQAVAVPGGGQPGVDGVGGDHLAGGQVVEQLGVGVVGGDQRAGDRRRDERARHRAVAELGEDDRQLEDAESLSANGFRQVHALQALLGRGLPVRRRVRDRRLERLVQHVRRRHARHQGPDRIGQVVVLRSDRDGHGCTSSWRAFPINRSVGTLAYPLTTLAKLAAVPDPAAVVDRVFQVAPHGVGGVPGDVRGQHHVVEARAADCRPVSARRRTRPGPRRPARRCAARRRARPRRRRRRGRC